MQRCFEHFRQVVFSFAAGFVAAVLATGTVWAQTDGSASGSKSGSSAEGSSTKPTDQGKVATSDANGSSRDAALEAREPERDARREARRHVGTSDRRGARHVGTSDASRAATAIRMCGLRFVRRFVRRFSLRRLKGGSRKETHAARRETRRDERQEGADTSGRATRVARRRRFGCAG